MTGEFRGKRLFAGRLFAGRLFGPGLVFAPTPPAVGGAGTGRRREPAIRRRDRDDDVLLFLLRTPL